VKPEQHEKVEKNTVKKSKQIEKYYTESVKWKERLEKMEIEGGDVKFQNYWTQLNNKNLDFQTKKQLGEYFI